MHACLSPPASWSVWVASLAWAGSGVGCGGGANPAAEHMIATTSRRASQPPADARRSWVEVAPGKIAAGEQAAVVVHLVAQDGSPADVTSLRDGEITLRFVDPQGRASAGGGGSLGGWAEVGRGVWQGAYLGVVAGPPRALTLAIKGADVSAPPPLVQVFSGLPTAASSRMIAAVGHLRSPADSLWLQALVRDTYGNAITADTACGASFAARSQNGQASVALALKSCQATSPGAFVIELAAAEPAPEGPICAWLGSDTPLACIAQPDVGRAATPRRPHGSKDLHATGVSLAFSPLSTVPMGAGNEVAGAPSVDVWGMVSPLGGGPLPQGAQFFADWHFDLMDSNSYIASGGVVIGDGVASLSRACGAGVNLEGIDAGESGEMGERSETTQVGWVQSRDSVPFSQLNTISLAYGDGGCARGAGLSLSWDGRSFFYFDGSLWAEASGDHEESNDVHHLGEAVLQTFAHDAENRRLFYRLFMRADAQHACVVEGVQAGGLL